MQDERPPLPTKWIRAEALRKAQALTFDETMVVGYAATYSTNSARERGRPRYGGETFLFIDMHLARAISTAKRTRIKRDPSIIYATERTEDFARKFDLSLSDCIEIMRRELFALSDAFERRRLFYPQHVLETWQPPDWPRIGSLLQ